MTETIGKITLNLDKYPGEDYYCDGSVEDEILDIVKNTVRWNMTGSLRSERAGRSCIICLLSGKISWISFPYRKQRKCWKWAADAEQSRVHWQEKPGK